MKIKSRVYTAIILTITILLIGVFGYMEIGNYSFIDALYMTVITISTVGFGEVNHPSGDSEKLFTIFLIFISIVVFAYIISVLTEYIINGKFIDELKHKKMLKKIKKIKNHTIVCGYGRNGRQSAQKLRNHKKICVIIENDKMIIKEIEKAGFLYVEGDATNDEVLEIACIENADNLIAALPSDADNLFIILSAKQYNKTATLISRASDDSSEKKLKIAGANNVIMPDKLGGNHMASLIVSPDIIEFIDKLSLNGNCETNLEEINVNDLPNELINKTFRDLDLRKKTGCSIIGLKTSDNNYIINPKSATKLVQNTKLIVLGSVEQIKKLHNLF